MVVSVVLVSYTVSAQDFLIRLLENSSFNDIAIVMVDTQDEDDRVGTVDSDSETLYLEEGLEEGLKDCQELCEDHPAKLLSDAPRQVEKWMGNKAAIRLETEDEASLNIETWMISDEVWNF